MVSDTFRWIRSNLRLAVSRSLRQLLLQLYVVKLGAQKLHRRLPILELATLLGAEDADAGRPVDKVHCRLNLFFSPATDTARETQTVKNTRRGRMFSSF